MFHLFHQVSMHATVNHIYPTSESCCSRTSITIHTCTTFPIEDRAFYLVFLYEHLMLSEGTIVDGAPIVLPTRSVTIL
jgi:hypothetical protein